MILVPFLDFFFLLGHGSESGIMYCLWTLVIEQLIAKQKIVTVPAHHKQY